MVKIENNNFLSAKHVYDRHYRIIQSTRKTVKQHANECVTYREKTLFYNLISG